MELNHFSHEHPLIFNEEHKVDGEEVYCSGCEEPILDRAYSCSQCDFFLHKTCAELPREINNSMHPQHPLTLLSQPSYYYSSCLCNGCRQSWNRFIYNCKLCEFDLCLLCALAERRIKHKSHDHPLTLQLRPALFHCDACGTRGEDFSYTCDTCPFWIHKICASYPTTVDCRDHDVHRLTLAYSLPEEYSKFKIRCEICSTRVLPPSWNYYCTPCRYFAHLKCATSESSTDSSSGSESEPEAEEDLDPNLIRLPVPDESINLISYFLKGTSQGEIQIATELNHFSHEHPLILCDKVEIKKDDQLSCSVCAQPNTNIAPFYSCSQCTTYFLHKSCAELPHEVQHPSHPRHPLLLSSKAPEIFTLCSCDGCRKFCNRFNYKCDPCNFALDLKCAFLPDAVAHEAHKHPLVRSNSNSRFHQCSACGDVFGGFVFGCDRCKFRLENHCALLPSIARHRYDKHPLTLIYPPFKDHPEEFYCEICEEEINPMFWLYHCRDCDQSFHTRCLRPKNMYSNIKLGGTYKLDQHPHHLTLRTRKSVKHELTCNCCGRSSCGEPVLVCAEWNFHVCLGCIVRKRLTKVLQFVSNLSAKMKETKKKNTSVVRDEKC